MSLPIRTPPNSAVSSRHASVGSIRSIVQSKQQLLLEEVSNPAPSRTNLATKEPAPTAAAAPPSTSAETSLSSHVVILESKEQLESVLSESGNKIVLLEFSADWCGPCRLIASKLEDLAQAYKDEAIVLKIDVDAFEDIALEYEITSMPTFLFIKQKKQILELVGSNIERIEKFLKKMCTSPARVSEGAPVTEAATTTKTRESAPKV